MLVRNGKSHYVTEFTTYKLHRLIVRSMHRLCVCVSALFSSFFLSFAELMFDLFISWWQSDFYSFLSVVAGSFHSIVFDVQKLNVPRN